MIKERIKSFLSFKVLITGFLIQSIYIIGALIVTIAPLFIPSDLNNSRLATFWLLLIILVANIAWRIICESWILFFKIYEALQNQRQ